MQILNVGFDKLKYIHHISDIQIRNLKRHTEYEEVFERTYKEIEKNKDNAVVYIGGDIAPVSYTHLTLPTTVSV